MKRIEKKKILVQAIELMIFCGYDISDFVGVSLLKFDFDKLKNFIEKLEKEKQEIEN